VESVGEFVVGGVAEDVAGFGPGLGADDSGALQVGEIGVKGDFAEADDDTEPGQQSDFLIQKWGTVAEFFRQRLVGGRGAADDGGDPKVGEGEAVAAVG